MTLSESDLQDQVTKLTSTAMTFRLVCIDNCWRSEPVPALSSRKPRILVSLEMSVCFPDAVTAYTIFFTLPVSVVSNELRSFSKLKLLKTYLRAATSHDRLSDLGILSIERDRFSEVDRRKILEMFAQRKAHKVRIL